MGKNISISITAKDTSQKLKNIDPQKLASHNNDHLPTLKINIKQKKQTILGFGGAFTEASAYVYSKLNNKKKNEIINAYFGKNGNQYNFARTHINSCDFSLGNYAYSEKSGDIELDNFSIDRDKKWLIPFIKACTKNARDPVFILASPWSPPAWMKTNGEMNNGGKLINKYQSTWAEYYCKYIFEYEKEGIDIWGISVQNEPMAKQTWDSCIYTSEEERDFIKNHLGPALEKNNLMGKKLVIWDHNRDIMVERASTILNDEKASKYVWGTGFHWYNGDHFDAVQEVHDKFPDKNLIFTEGCQENGPHIGSWALGERYATSIINDLNRWTVAWIDWNLILNEDGGPNHVNNLCSAPIIVDTKKQDILYQSSYYYLGHFSRFIKRGDKIIKTDLDSDNLLALSSLNNKGTINTIVMNKKEETLGFKYVSEKENEKILLPPRSIITISESNSDNNQLNF